MFKVCNNDFSFLNINEKEKYKLRQKCSNKYTYLKSILLVALNTGMRKSEILNLTWDCVDFDTNEITVLDTKMVRRILSQ